MAAQEYKVVATLWAVVAQVCAPRIHTLRGALNGRCSAHLQRKLVTMVMPSGEALSMASIARAPSSSPTRLSTSAVGSRRPQATSCRIAGMSAASRPCEPGWPNAVEPTCSVVPQRGAAFAPPVGKACVGACWAKSARWSTFALTHDNRLGSERGGCLEP